MYIYIYIYHCGRGIKHTLLILCVHISFLTGFKIIICLDIFHPIKKHSLPAFWGKIKTNGWKRMLFDGMKNFFYYFKSCQLLESSNNWFQARKRHLTKGSQVVVWSMKNDYPTETQAQTWNRNPSPAVYVPKKLESVPLPHSPLISAVQVAQLGALSSTQMYTAAAGILILFFWLSNVFPNLDVENTFTLPHYWKLPVSSVCPHALLSQNRPKEKRMQSVFSKK